MKLFDMKDPTESAKRVLWGIACGLPLFVLIGIPLIFLLFGFFARWEPGTVNQKDIPAGTVWVCEEYSAQVQRTVGGNSGNLTDQNGVPHDVKLCWNEAGRYSYVGEAKLDDTITVSASFRFYRNRMELYLSGSELEPLFGDDSVALELDRQQTE